MERKPVRVVVVYDDGTKYLYVDGAQAITTLIEKADIDVYHVEEPPSRYELECLRAADRKAFACAALIGLLANPNELTLNNVMENAEEKWARTKRDVVDVATEFADALLLALSTPSVPPTGKV